MHHANNGKVQCEKTVSNRSLGECSEFSTGGGYYQRTRSINPDDNEKNPVRRETVKGGVAGLSDEYEGATVMGTG